MSFSYQISVMDSCSWDTVYAAKLTCFPFEPRDYKPFAQGRLCFCPREGLHVRLLSFETKAYLQAGPLALSSCLTLFLQGGEGSPLLRITADSTGKAECFLDGQAIPAPVLKPFGGEDLQGIYWGVEYLLEPALLNKIHPQGITSETILSGNMLTSRFGSEKPYFGSLFPTDPSIPGEPLYTPNWLEKTPALGQMIFADY